MKTIKVGDQVMWRGCWNQQPSIVATITGIELTPSFFCTSPNIRYKYGVPVNEVETANKDKCVFTLDNGHWAYGNQITPIAVNELAEMTEGYEIYYSL